MNTITIKSYDEFNDIFTITVETPMQKMTMPMSGFVLPLIINEHGSPDELIGKTFTRNI